MNDSIRLGKRAFAIATAVATIMWSIGFSAFVAPLTADAQSMQAGDLIRGETLSTVYYYATDGQRYAFPNPNTYFSWYSDFSGVEFITDSELAAVPLGGNIVDRPGSSWIKIQSDPKTYAVTPQGQIRWIESESVAMGLAGSDWNQMILDVPDVFFTDYTVGPSLTTAMSAYNGALVDDNGTTVLVWNGEKRMVTSTGFSANRFQNRHILDGDGIDLSGMPSGADITAEVPELTDTAQMGGVSTGGLNVSLASDTPASATLPGGADSVKFTKIQLQAQSGSASVDQLVFKLGGVGSVNNIDDAYLYDGSMRLTDGRSVNSNTRNATFSALNIDLNSGETMHLTVRADTSTNASGGDTANFGLQSESSVSSSASVSGNFPITGNTMTFSNQDAGTIDVDATGSISNPTLGEDGATIAKFKMEVDTEDADLEELTLSVDDAADHSNYKLWRGSDLLADGVSDGDELVTFELTNPFFLEEGSSRNFEVTADIGGDSGEDVIVAVEETADVAAVGRDFGFNLSVDIADYDETNCTSSAGDCSFSTVEGGDLTFAFNGPTTGDIQIDGNDQVLMNFTITSGNWVEIEQIDVIVRCRAEAGGACDNAADDEGLLNNTESEANYTDFILRTSAGGTWMGPEELDATNAGASSADDVVQTLSYTDNQVLQAGESLDLMVTVDVENHATEDDEVRVELDMSSVDAEDVNGDTLASGDIVPSSDLVGNDFTLQDASLDVTVATPPSSATYVKGANNVPVVGFSFGAGDTSDINVTDVTYSTNADNGTDGDPTNDTAVTVQDKVNSCSMYDSESGALIDGPESPNTNGQVLFNNFDWLIPAGETKKNILRCNYANVDIDGGTSDQYAFFIDDNGDIVSEDDDGDDVTETLGTNNSGATPTTVITVVDAGSISVSLDGSSPSADIILGASTGVTTSVFKFQATDENFTVTDLTLVNCVGETSNNNADCDTAGADGVDDIAATVKISYKDAAGDTKTKSGFLSGNAVKFSSLDFFVPADSTRMLTVTVDTGTVSSQGSNSGDQIQLNLADSGSYIHEDNTTTTAEFEAVGDASGTTLEDFGGNATVDTIAARDMTVRKTKPTLSLNSNSPSGGAVPGFDEVLRFNVAADSRGFVTMDTFTFTLASTDNAGTPTGWNTCGAADLEDPAKWTFYDAADPSEELDDDTDWIFHNTAGADDSCTTDGTAGAEDITHAELQLDGDTTTPVEEIGAGETKTYVLEIDTTGASSSADDSVRVDIPRQSTVNGLANIADAIEWDDDVEGDDINGQFIKNLPVRGGTLIY